MFPLLFATTGIFFFWEKKNDSDIFIGAQMQPTGMVVVFHGINAGYRIWHGWPDEVHSIDAKKMRANLLSIIISNIILMRVCCIFTESFRRMFWLTKKIVCTYLNDENAKLLYVSQIRVQIF